MEMTLISVEIDPIHVTFMGRGALMNEEVGDKLSKPMFIAASCVQIGLLLCYYSGGLEGNLVRIPSKISKIKVINLLRDYIPP